MALDNERDFKRAFDYGGPVAKFPLPTALLDAEDRAHIWGSFIVPLNPIPDSPYYIPNMSERAQGTFIEQFKREYING